MIMTLDNTYHDKIFTHPIIPRILFTSYTKMHYPNHIHYRPHPIIFSETVQRIRFVRSKLEFDVKSVILKHSNSCELRVIEFINVCDFIIFYMTYGDNGDRKIIHSRYNFMRDSAFLCDIHTTYIKTVGRVALPIWNNNDDNNNQKSAVCV
mgnify:CR=1 FL=1